MKKPNLFIVGAARSGTTFLWSSLKNCPQVFMPDRIQKEPAYFSELKQSRYRTLPEYMEIYKKADSRHRYLGDASTAYLTDPESARKIFDFNPRAKILISLRDPALRAYSLYKKMVQEGYELADTFFEGLSQEEIRVRKKIPNYFEPEYYHNYLYFRSGLYFEQVKRYLDLFGDQVLIIKFEKLVSDFKSEFQRVCDFLEISPANYKGAILNRSHKNVSAVQQFLLRKITRFLLLNRDLIEQVREDRQNLKKIVFTEAGKELDRISQIKKIRVLQKLRIRRILAEAVRQIHSRKINLSLNSKSERDALLAMGYGKERPEMIEGAIYTELSRKYAEDVSLLTEISGLSFTDWGNRMGICGEQ